MTMIHLDSGGLAAHWPPTSEPGSADAARRCRPKYFYDARGQRAVRRDHPAARVLPDPDRARDPRARMPPTIAALTRAETLVELGSGTSEKTRLLLRALREAGTLRRFVAVRRGPGRAGGGQRGGRRGVPRPRGRDRSSATSSGTSASCLPRIRVGCWRSSGRPSATSSRPAARRSSPPCARRWGPATPSCWAPTWSSRRSGWSAAYDDAAGVTAAFNKNVLAVLDRELDADFDLDAFEHVAVWDAEHEWIEMRLRSSIAQTVTVARLDLQISFDRGRGDAHRDLGQVPARERRR